MLRTLFSRRFLFATLLVLAAMAVMIRLGVWQLERREQRLARNADLTAKLAAAPLSLNAVALYRQPLPDTRATVRNVPAEATGEFDFAGEMLLVQQPYNGQPGAHWIVPLRLSDSNKAVLVDRGWLPFDDVASGRWQQYPRGQAPVTVRGVLQPSQLLPGTTETPPAGRGERPAQPQIEWYRVDIAAMQSQLPYPLLPVYLLAGADDAVNRQPPVAIEPEVDLSEGPHLGYALQWFAFAATAGVVYVAAVRKRSAQ
ncbi:MAG: SURF1 family protein [Caldilineales bacterium]